MGWSWTPNIYQRESWRFVQGRTGWHVWRRTGIGSGLKRWLLKRKIRCSKMQWSKNWFIERIGFVQRFVIRIYITLNSRIYCREQFYGEFCLKIGLFKSIESNFLMLLAKISNILSHCLAIIVWLTYLSNFE